MALTISVHPRLQPATAEGFTRRLASVTSAQPLGIGKDRRGVISVIYPEVDSASEMLYVADGLKKSSDNFWTIIRKVNRIPPSVKTVPTGHLLMRLDDRIGVMSSGMINKKTLPKPVDTVNYVLTGVYTPIGRKIDANEHKKRGSSLGKQSIRDLLSVNIDGY